MLKKEREREREREREKAKILSANNRSWEFSKET